MANLEDLRVELKRRRQLANRKVRRIENEGVEIAGTKHDPRSQTDVKKLNVKQLQSELNKLTTFSSRRTQFVGGHRGRPIPIVEWRKYSAAQKAANESANALYERYRNIVIDRNGTTIGERDAYTRSDFPNTANPAVNSPFKKIERVPRQVTTQKALKQMTKQQQAKIDPKHMENFVREGKRDLRKMLKVAGQSDMMRDIDKLTTKQFHILWGFTSFAMDISIAYENGKRAEKHGPSRSDEQTTQGSMDGAREMLDFIKTIPDDDSKPSRRRRK